jgi:lipopolysaccharide heptosyltransferase III
MRILFISATRIGDAVLSSGILQHLIARYPAARITVAVGRISAPLFEAMPGLEQLIRIDKRPFELHWLGLWRTVAPRRWDMVVDLRASAIAYLLWTRQRFVIGSDAHHRHHHRVEELAELIDARPPPSPTVWLAVRDEDRAARLIPVGDPVLAVGPAANWLGKQWPAARFAEMVRRLTAPGAVLAGARLAVLAAAHERAQAQAAIEAVPAERLIDLVGTVDLPTAAACLRRCALFVGNDSGLMHMAAAAGVPTLGLFGPTPSDRYGPWGEHTAIVRTREPADDLLARYRSTPDAVGELMASLSVESAVSAAEALWRRPILPIPATPSETACATR